MCCPSPLSDFSDLGDRTHRHRVVCTYKDRQVVVSTDDICYIRMEAKCVRVYTRQQTNYETGLSLAELEEELDPVTFFRANRQDIVHLSAVDSLTTDATRKTFVHLTFYPEVVIPVSKERYGSLKRWLGR